MPVVPLRSRPERQLVLVAHRRTWARAGAGPCCCVGWSAASIAATSAAPASRGPGPRCPRRRAAAVAHSAGRPPRLPWLLRPLHALAYAHVLHATCVRCGAAVIARRLVEPARTRMFAPGGQRARTPDPARRGGRRGEGRGEPCSPGEMGRTAQRQLCLPGVSAASSRRRWCNLQRAQRKRPGALT
jgi:hypothetical protein